MRTRIAYHDVAVEDPDRRWRDQCDALLAREVLPLLEKQGAADGSLYVTLSRSRRDAGGFVAQLQFHPPGKKIMVARGAGRDPGAALEEAVRNLSQEASRHFDALRGRRRSNRKARRARLETLRTRIAAMPESVQHEARTCLDTLVGRLKRVARRELAYLRAVGDLPSDYPTVDDVVDEALAETTAAWQAGCSTEEAWRAALRNLFRVIDREVSASRLYGEALSLEAPLPPDPQDQAEAMVEEEIYEYYQVDDVVTLADVVPEEATDSAAVEGAVLGAVAPGAGTAEQASAQAFIWNVLKDLPIGWRRALLLSQVDEMDLEAVSKVLDVREEEVDAWIAQARSFVVTRCRDAGVIVRDEELRSAWLGLPEGSAKVDLHARRDDAHTSHSEIK